MLDSRNTDILISIAQNPDSSAATRVNACTLINQLSALPAKEIIEILQDTIDDLRTKDGVRVKAMALIDKINSSTGIEPELRSEDVDDIKTKLMEKYLVCPPQSTT
jgi:hypothetical protein